jgi:hypothetical protein
MADQEQWLLMSNQSLMLTNTNKLELMDVLLLLLLFPSFPVIIRVVLQEQPKALQSSAFIIHHKAGALGCLHWLCCTCCLQQLSLRLPRPEAANSNTDCFQAWTAQGTTDCHVKFTIHQLVRIAIQGDCVTLTPLLVCHSFADMDLD